MNWSPEDRHEGGCGELGVAGPRLRAGGYLKASVQGTLHHDSSLALDNDLVLDVDVHPVKAVTSRGPRW